MFFEELQIFTTIFLAIFLEALPFLLLGTLASGLVDVFISREQMTRLVPKNTVVATVLGGVLGMAFPVCECGVVPLTHRLFRKGFPISAGVAFLLAAPILNPITLASTYAAYGWSDVLFGRYALGLLIPVTIGLLFFRNRRDVLRDDALPEDPSHSQNHPTHPVVVMAAPAITLEASGQTAALAMAQADEKPKNNPQHFGRRLQRALVIAGDETFGMGRYLVVGCALAALMQTIVPQASLLELGSGPVSSVLTMQLLGFVLSVCSTVDAFISLAFVSTFTVGSILAFLVFGPMVDVKSTLMFLGVFKRRYVLLLIFLPFTLTGLSTILINLLLT